MQERSHKNEVTLNEEQRFVLQQLISKGNAPVRQQAHARILLKIDRNAPGPRWTDEQVAEAFEMSRYTVIRVRERFVNNGLDDALNHRKHTSQTHPSAFDGEQEAHLIALSCSPCPGGKLAGRSLACWSDGGVGLCGADQPRNGAKNAEKNELKPWLKQCWCIPAEASAAFVWRMEDVLEVYTRVYDPRFPQVCMDESAKHLLQDKRESLPLQSGKPERVDYTFESAGMCKLFLACEPLAANAS